MSLDSYNREPTVLYLDKGATIDDIESFIVSQCGVNFNEDYCIVKVTVSGDKKTINIEANLEGD